VNTDISEQHAMTTKRAVPVESAHSRTQGRDAQRTRDATIATATLERAKLCRESASATKSFPVGLPPVQPPAPRR